MVKSSYESMNVDANDTNSTTPVTFKCKDNLYLLNFFFTTLLLLPLDPFQNNTSSLIKKGPLYKTPIKPKPSSSNPLCSHRHCRWRFPFDAPAALHAAGAHGTFAAEHPGAFDHREGHWDCLALGPLECVGFVLFNWWGLFWKGGGESEVGV